MSSVPQAPLRPELYFHAEGALNPEVSTVRRGEGCWRICYCARDRTDLKGSREEPKALTILAGLVEFECRACPSTHKRWTSPAHRMRARLCDTPGCSRLA